MNAQEIESRLAGWPVYDYRIIPSTEVLFDTDRIGAICATNDCGLYGRRWICPPATEALEGMASDLAYNSCLVISTATDVSHLLDFSGDLQAREDHELLTREILTWLREEAGGAAALSTGCYGCRECTFPDSPCRFPERAIPPVEAHGVNLMIMAENLGMDWYFGTSVVLYFSMFFFNAAEN